MPCGFFLQLLVIFFFLHFPSFNQPQKSVSVLKSLLALLILPQILFFKSLNQILNIFKNFSKMSLFQSFSLMYYRLAKNTNNFDCGHSGRTNWQSRISSSVNLPTRFQFRSMGTHNKDLGLSTTLFRSRVCHFISFPKKWT